MILPKYFSQTLFLAFLFIFASSSFCEAETLKAKIKHCRVQLAEMEGMRDEAKELGNLDLFDGLIFHAESILEKLEASRHSDPMYLYLLGECQGVLNSLRLTLDLTKYPHRKVSPRPLPSRSPPRPHKTQSVSSPGSQHIREPLPPDPFEGMSEEEGKPIQCNQRPSKSTQHPGEHVYKDDVICDH